MIILSKTCKLFNAIYVSSSVEPKRWLELIVCEYPVLCMSSWACHQALQNQAWATLSSRKQPTSSPRTSVKYFPWYQKGFCPLLFSQKFAPATQNLNGYLPGWMPGILASNWYCSMSSNYLNISNNNLICQFSVIWCLLDYKLPYYTTGSAELF